ncbi:hypothetical protein D3C86_2161530 [compost metagenome]
MLLGLHRGVSVDRPVAHLRLFADVVVLPPAILEYAATFWRWSLHILAGEHVRICLFHVCQLLAVVLEFP